MLLDAAHGVVDAPCSLAARAWGVLEPPVAAGMAKLTTPHFAQWLLALVKKPKAAPKA